MLAHLYTNITRVQCRIHRETQLQLPDSHLRTKSKTSATQLGTWWTASKVHCKVRTTVGLTFSQHQTEPQTQSTTIAWDAKLSIGGTTKPPSAWCEPANLINEEDGKLRPFWLPSIMFQCMHVLKSINASLTGSHGETQTWKAYQPTLGGVTRFTRRHQCEQLTFWCTVIRLIIFTQDRLRCPDTGRQRKKPAKTQTDQEKNPEVSHANRKLTAKTTH